MVLILDAIKGSHGEQSEDRLTQVFCACFNNSHRFRQLFLKFISQKGGAGTFRATTQEQYAIRGASCRADILIGKPGNQPSIVVENKIDSPLTPHQLRTYNRIPQFHPARKIALVKHYFEMEQVPGWDILHWADFHSTLKLSRPAVTPIDAFIVSEFVELLEELGMARALVIERKRLGELARFMKTLRGPKLHHPLGSETPFETATAYLGMVEDIVNQMHEEPLFRKRLGKKVRFSPRLTWWSEDDQGKKRHPLLGVEIELRKPYKGIAVIATAILFQSNRGTFTVQTYALSEWRDFLFQIFHRGDLRFESYAKKVIAFWKDQLA
jgi:hypothetical protein